MTPPTACVAWQNVGTMDAYGAQEWTIGAPSTFQEQPPDLQERNEVFNAWQQAGCSDIATMFGRDAYASLVAFQEKLQELETLPEGWDDEGSPPPNRDLLLAADSLMERLLTGQAGELFDCHADIPSPFPSPVPGGGLQLEWRSAQRYLELEFVNSHTIAFLQKSENGWFRPGRMRVENTGEVRRLLEWFMSP